LKEVKTERTRSNGTKVSSDGRSNFIGDGGVELYESDSRATLADGLVCEYRRCG
jgi:hypothetical protein